LTRIRSGLTISFNMMVENRISLSPRTKEDCLEIVGKSFELWRQKVAPTMTEKAFKEYKRFSFLAYVYTMLNAASEGGEIDIIESENLLKEKMSNLYKGEIFERAKILFQEGDWENLLIIT